MKTTMTYMAQGVDRHGRKVDKYVDDSGDTAQFSLMKALQEIASYEVGQKIWFFLDYNCDGEGEVERRREPTEHVCPTCADFGAQAPLFDTGHELFCERCQRGTPYEQFTAKHECATCRFCLVGTFSDPKWPCHHCFGHTMWRYGGGR